MKTSIILTSYIEAQHQAHLTMACVANITRYTDPEDYELIMMNAGHKFPIRDDYKCLKIDKNIETDLGYTAAMNEGARLATGEILVFLQNDVFVWEGWLPKLRYYIEHNLADCVIPDQMPRPREFVKQAEAMTMEEGMKFGSRDAGCIMITKKAFEKMGGWDADLSLLAERDLFERFGQFGIRQIDTCKVMISHIMAATNLYRYHVDNAEYEIRMHKDEAKLNT